MRIFRQIFYRIYDNQSMGLNDGAVGFQSVCFKKFGECVVLQDLNKEDLKTSVVDHIEAEVVTQIEEIVYTRSRRKRKKLKTITKRMGYQSYWISFSGSLLTTFQPAV
jgi:hypothetical protein